MINPILFLLAIPLSLIGYLLKHGTRISNKLIPVIISVISTVLCFIWGKVIGIESSISIVIYSLVNGILVAAVATHGWDSTYGIKTVMFGLTARAYKLINLDREGNMDKLKKWHKRLLSNGLAVLGIAIITFGIGYLNLMRGNASMAVIIDTTVLSVIFVSAGLLALSLIKKIIEKDPTLNGQYMAVFTFAGLAIGAFLVAYVAPTWDITIFSAVIFVISTFLTLFLGRYSYIPSLRTQEEVIQDIVKKRWEEYKGLSDEEVMVRLKQDFKYSFKYLKWGSEADTSSPLFPAVDGNLLTVKDAADLNNPNYQELIKKHVANFMTVIKTRPAKVEVK